MCSSKWVYKKKKEFKEWLPNEGEDSNFSHFLDRFAVYLSRLTWDFYSNKRQANEEDKIEISFLFCHYFSSTLCCTSNCWLETARLGYAFPRMMNLPFKCKYSPSTFGKYCPAQKLYGMAWAILYKQLDNDELQYVTLQSVSKFFKLKYLQHEWSGQRFLRISQSRQMKISISSCKLFRP